MGRWLGANVISANGSKCISELVGWQWAWVEWGGGGVRNLTSCTCLTFGDNRSVIFFKKTAELSAGNDSLTTQKLQILVRLQNMLCYSNTRGQLPFTAGTEGSRSPKLQKTQTHYSIKNTSSRPPPLKHSAACVCVCVCSEACHPAAAFMVCDRPTYKARENNSRQQVKSQRQFDLKSWLHVTRSSYLHLTKVI